MPEFLVTIEAKFRVSYTVEPAQKGINDGMNPPLDPSYDAYPTEIEYQIHSDINKKIEKAVNIDFNELKEG